MEQVELLTVEHRFFISRPGVQMLVLGPHFRMPKGWSERGWGQRQEQVTVIRPDGSSLPATAQINVTHLNIRGPDVPIEARWPITVWLTDRTEDEIPEGSKIMVVARLREIVMQVVGTNRVLPLARLTDSIVASLRFLNGLPLPFWY